jgi:hypothetical protein
MTARKELLDLIEKPEPFDRPAAELAPMRLQAARELFNVRRQQIPILDRRAKEAGIEEIRTLHDLVPLLFAHTVYKSHPQALIENNRWDRMAQWLDTLSVENTAKIDFAGVTDVDDWIDRLREAGHMILATSGTTGKSSFLNQTPGDIDERRRYFQHAKGWPYVEPKRDRPFFALGPSRGPTSLVEAYHLHADVFGRPGEIHFLTDEPIRVSEISRMAQLRKRIAEGRVSPGELREMEEKARARQAEMKGAVERLASLILARRREPVYITGMYPQHVLVIDAAHALGGEDGRFHRESVVHIGGGVKNAALPPDYGERVARFYGDVHDAPTYGMTEMAQALVRCEAKRYHVPPAQIVLLLDQPGERLLSAEDAGPDGHVVGRFAFLDLLYEGRWGGLISGDRVTVDFSERCPCGRHGPTVLDTIGRFSQSGEDDPIGCAGTLDAYIRGVLAS